MIVDIREIAQLYLVDVIFADRSIDGEIALIWMLLVIIVERRDTVGECPRRIAK